MYNFCLFSTLYLVLGDEFAGWYKEAECINKWDFSKDKTSDLYRRYYEPDEDDSEEYKKEYYEYISTHTYVETKLYAKWIKNKLEVDYDFKICT